MGRGYGGYQHFVLKFVLRGIKTAFFVAGHFKIHLTRKLELWRYGDADSQFTQN